MTVKPKAIVVDDDISLGSAFKAALELCGFDVERVDDGTKALAEIREKMPDIVMLDMQMPKTSGKEILQQVRADKTIAHTKVIIVTASGQAAADESLREMADLLLMKPVTLNQIVDFASRLTRK